MVRWVLLVLFGSVLNESTKRVNIHNAGLEVEGADMADPGVVPPIVLEAGMVKVLEDTVLVDWDLGMVEGVDMQPCSRPFANRVEEVTAADSLDNRLVEGMRDD